MMGPEFLFSTGRFPFSKGNGSVIVTDIFLDPNLELSDCCTVFFSFRKSVPLFQGGTTRKVFFFKSKVGPNKEKPAAFIAKYHFETF